MEENRILQMNLIDVSNTNDNGMIPHCSTGAIFLLIT